VQQGAVLVDVREPDEVASGSPLGAVRLGRGFLEQKIETVAPDVNRPVLLICESGSRSLFAAGDLARLGYRKVSSVAGGFNRWKESGLPIEHPTIFEGAAPQRYARHLVMPEVGEAGQRRLLASKVLLVGVGGLGSPAALYLAAAGVGAIGLVDDDRVERSNLQRQVIHNEAWIGRPKVESARAAISSLNPDVTVTTHHCRLESGNVDEIVAGYDVVLDGSDNFPTRYLVNDACIKHSLPNVHGSVFRFHGQVTVFHAGDRGKATPCYRCLFPEPPAPSRAPSCSEAGVLGALPGVIGTMQALETIKVLLGCGDCLLGRLLIFDALKMQFVELPQERDPDCAYCGDGKVFPGYVDYQGFCSSR
jgi:molybdopterin/thiamine biosynthesis adenylyltransferase/rhodanese-related sulfurtransferase